MEAELKPPVVDFEFKQEHPRLGGTPLAMLAAQCNKLASKSPPPLADAAVGKGFHPWKKVPNLSQQTNSSSSSASSPPPQGHSSSTPLGSQQPHQSQHPRLGHSGSPYQHNHQRSPGKCLGHFLASCVCLCTCMYLHVCDCIRLNTCVIGKEGGAGRG